MLCGWKVSHGTRGQSLVYREVFETLRNYKKINSGDLEILLVVIQLGVAGLKKIRLVYLLDLFEGRGEKGQCDLACVECHQQICFPLMGETLI